MKIHGLYVGDREDKSIVVALETVDNQIDFNKFIVLNRPGGNPRQENDEEDDGLDEDGNERKIDTEFRYVF